MNKLVFTIVILVLVVGLFLYFVKSRMGLPNSAFTENLGRRKEQKRDASRRETVDVDVVLDKISREGMDSLTDEEQELLQSVSKKFQSRAQSEKPKSDLII